MHWYYHQPVFAADSAPELPREFMTHGAWSGHRRFAYDLVRFARPRTIVELGTLYGTSFFTFCQAVKDGQLAARCFAVDTWKGDPHVGSYDDVVYQAVQAVTAREFPQIGTLVRSDFDGAVNLFADGSICASYRRLSHLRGRLSRLYDMVSEAGREWNRTVP